MKQGKQFTTYDASTPDKKPLMHKKRLTSARKVSKVLDK